MLNVKKSVFFVFFSKLVFRWKKSGNGPLQKTCEKENRWVFEKLMDAIQPVVLVETGFDDSGKLFLRAFLNASVLQWKTNFWLCAFFKSIKT